MGLYGFARRQAPVIVVTLKYLSEHVLFIHSCVPMVLSVATLGESGRAERQAAKPSALAQRTDYTDFLSSCS